MSKLDAQTHSAMRADNAGRERDENNENHTSCNGIDAVAIYNRLVFQ
jgi:hypothetical protein